MKKTERTRLETLLKRRTSDSLSPDETRILIRLSAKRAAELHHLARDHYGRNVYRGQFCEVVRIV